MYCKNNQRAVALFISRFSFTGLFVKRTKLSACLPTERHPWIIISRQPIISLCKGIVPCLGTLMDWRFNIPSVSIHFKRKCGRYWLGRRDPSRDVSCRHAVHSGCHPLWATQILKRCYTDWRLHCFCEVGTNFIISNELRTSVVMPSACLTNIVQPIHWYKCAISVTCYKSFSKFRATLRRRLFR